MRSLSIPINKLKILSKRDWHWLALQNLSLTNPIQDSWDFVIAFMSIISYLILRLLTSLKIKIFTQWIQKLFSKIDLLRNNSKNYSKIINLIIFLRNYVSWILCKCLLNFQRKNTSSLVNSIVLCCWRLRITLTSSPLEIISKFNSRKMIKSLLTISLVV